MQSILITGSAGFIGSNLVKRLLKDIKEGIIVGVDNLNDYYDVSLKEYRLKEIETIYSAVSCQPSAVKYHFIKGSISDKELINKLFEDYKFNIVVNMAAQAGVRHSIANPALYVETNINGFFNILEACRNHSVQHLVFASSSSVYGGSTKIPFVETDRVDHPVSLYAATKKSNELMAHTYSKLYGIPCTGMRFFTVYGPAGRPDMAYFGFTNKLLKGEKIQIFNYGKCLRDFTYIDDIVEGVSRVIRKAPTGRIHQQVQGSTSSGSSEQYDNQDVETTLSDAPYAIYNIGNSHPENLLEFVDILQQELVRVGVLPADYDFEAHKELVPMQAGDVPVTYADTSALERDFGYKPNTNLREGLRRFVEWYKEFYR